MYTVPPKQDVHQATTLRITTGTICRVCYWLCWAHANHIKRSQTCTNLYLFVKFLAHYSIPEHQNSRWGLGGIPWRRYYLQLPALNSFLQDNGTIGNRRIENVHSFLKHTIAKFTYDSQLEWDDVLPLATYFYNKSSSVDDLESPFYLVHGRDSIKGSLSNLQKLL